MRYGVAVAIILVLLGAGAGAGAEAEPTVNAPTHEQAATLVPVLHRRLAITTYCYDRSYWWFYRPYTTANDGHLRCMPYFRYPVQGPYKQESRPEGAAVDCFGPELYRIFRNPLSARAMMWRQAMKDECRRGQPMQRAVTLVFAVALCAYGTDALARIEAVAARDLALRAG